MKRYHGRYSERMIDELLNSGRTESRNYVYFVNNRYCDSDKDIFLDITRCLKSRNIIFDDPSFRDTININEVINVIRRFI